MVASAPRYEERILVAIRELDDRREPIAEICRRVAARAELSGLTRPSYVHVRRLVHADRRSRDEIGELVSEILDDVARHRPVDAYKVAAALADIAARDRLRRDAGR
jgi:hypothetical protein